MKLFPTSFFKHPLVVGIIMLVLGLMANPIYQNFQTFQNTNLKIQGEYYTFRLPLPLNNFSTSYSDQIKSDRLEEIATDSGRLDLKQFEQYSFILNKYLRDLPAVESIREAQYYNSYWTFTLENKANSRIENVTLILPFSGYYEFISEESKTISSGTYENKIDIGNLKPSNVAFIRVWSSERVIINKNKPYFLSGFPRVTFDNGFKLVEF